MRRMSPVEDRSAPRQEKVIEMLEQSAPQFPSSPDSVWRGSAAANLERSRVVRSETRGGTESVVLGNVPEAAGCLMELLDETNKLMGEVQTALRRIGVELGRLGISPSTLPDSCRPPACPELDLLSPRESEIVQLLVAGNRVSSIAQSLFISHHTVRNHLQSVYRKFEVSSQAGLIEKLKGSARPSLVHGRSPRRG